MIINGEKHNDLCIGIDLGTTNSVLAQINIKPNGDLVSKVIDLPRPDDTISADGRTSSIKSPTLPSFVYYREDKNYEPVIGNFAKKQYSLRPHLVAKSIKSQMGKSEAEGLSPDVPDKTPAQISSRILEHMIKNASRILRSDIYDAIITVPANFDPAMCQATKEAARLAGIQVIDSNGKERPILLSEPNAVIYDLINQIRNGEISNSVLDVTQKKTVMVFDLGGGTLDITLHEIRPRPEAPETIKVDEIATNRYTLLGGDDFDEELAKEIYKRYLKQYSKKPEIVKIIQDKEKNVMPQIRVFAEGLKLEVSEKHISDNSSWGNEDEVIAVGGLVSSTGIALDVSFTVEEVEEIFSCFMGKNIKYQDYKNIEHIADQRNIIYPILDVLKKAENKLGEGNFHIDEVIVNGGMSKFYLITDRLKEFFGKEPIIALDPDLSVARGAAIYHHYLHQYAELQDDMRLTGDACEIERENTTKSSIKKNIPIIEWGNKILNDSLYLGLKNGNVCEIVPTGAALPYSSEYLTGFKMEPHQSWFEIPIKTINADGKTYRTIAKGRISFERNYPEGIYVCLKIFMDKEKIITMNAYTTISVNGQEFLETGRAEIEINNNLEKTKGSSKIIAPAGTKLVPIAEINNLIQLCNNNAKKKKGITSKKIKAIQTSIIVAQNRNDFSRIILDLYTKLTNEEAKGIFLIISRRIGMDWSSSERRELAALCLRELAPELCSIGVCGPRVNTLQQAIMTLAICGSDFQIEQLRSLQANKKFLQPLIYTYAKSNKEVEWIMRIFKEDVKKVLSRNGERSIQSTAWAMGIMFKKTKKYNNFDEVKERSIINMLINSAQSSGLNGNELANVILAMGLICDQRDKSFCINGNIIDDVNDCLQIVPRYYTDKELNCCGKALVIAQKMVAGDTLSNEEELFLLEKTEEN